MSEKIKIKSANKQDKVERNSSEGLKMMAKTPSVEHEQKMKLEMEKLDKFELKIGLGKGWKKVQVEQKKKNGSRGKKRRKEVQKKK